MHETPFPLPLADYVDPIGGSLLDVLASRLAVQPINGVATAVFILAVLHTFVANTFRRWAHDAQHAYDAELRARGETPHPSFKAEMLHFFGEVEVVFGLWVLVLLAAISMTLDWQTAKTYITGTVHYTEPMFVVVIMTMAATRPVVGFAQNMLRRVAALGGGTPAAWWFTILTLGPVLGSFITEPAALTICALLRQFIRCSPKPALRYARPAVRQRVDWRHLHALRGATGADGGRALGLVVRLMATHFGWKAGTAILVSTLGYFLLFRQSHCRDHGRRHHRGRRRPGAGHAVVDYRGIWPSWASCGTGTLSRPFHRRVPVLPRLRAGHVALSVAHRPEAAPAGGVLPRRPGHARRAPGLVDRADAARPGRAAALLERNRADRVQRQRAHHVPGDAGARPG
jgi:hypothetical protein